MRENLDEGWASPERLPPGFVEDVREVARVMDLLRAWAGGGMKWPEVEETVEVLRGFVTRWRGHPDVEAVRMAEVDRVVCDLEEMIRRAGEGG